MHSSGLGAPAPGQALHGALGTQMHPGLPGDLTLVGETGAEGSVRKPVSRGGQESS